MNSSRSNYVPLEEDRSFKWMPLFVAAIAGGLAGLTLSEAFASKSSLYTSTEVIRSVPVQSRPMEWRSQVAHSSVASNAQPAPEVYLNAPEQAQPIESSLKHLASLAVIPLAAAAGFLLASRANREPPVGLEPFEVVIDDGEADIAMAATTGAKTDLYAVVAIGGHQYVVQPGQVLSIDKLPLEIGDEFTFEKVLLLKNGEKVDFGHPYLSSAKVTAEVLRNSKGRKIRIFKYRAKKHTRVTKGHRQKYTDIHITEVAGQRVPSKVPSLVSA